MFDTFQSSVGFDDFIEKDVPPGSIVIAACKDECITKLSFKGYFWFRDMGSKAIDLLKWRCAFAFIGVIGGKQPVEQYAEDEDGAVSVTQVFQLDIKAGSMQQIDPLTQKTHATKIKLEVVSETTETFDQDPKPKIPTGKRVFENQG